MGEGAGYEERTPKFYRVVDTVGLSVRLEVEGEKVKKNQ